MINLGSKTSQVYKLYCIHRFYQCMTSDITDNERKKFYLVSQVGSVDHLPSWHKEWLTAVAKEGGCVVTLGRKSARADALSVRNCNCWCVTCLDWL